MQERKRQLAWIKSFQGQMQHHRGILADRVQHDRFLELGSDLTDNVDALGFKLFKMRRLIRVHRSRIVGGCERHQDRTD